MQGVVKVDEFKYLGSTVMSGEEESAGGVTSKSEREDLQDAVRPAMLCGL